MDKPVFVDGTTVIESDFLNAVAGTVWDALGEATDAASARVALDVPDTAHTHLEADVTDLDKYTQAETDALLDALPEDYNWIRNPQFYIATGSLGSSPQTTNGMKLLDGWRFESSGGTHSIVQGTNSDSMTASYKARRHMEATITAGTLAAHYSRMKQRKLRVYELTGAVSLKAVGYSSGSYTYGVSVLQHFGTGGSPSANVETHLGTFALTASANAVEVLGTIPSISGKTLGTNNDDYMELRVWFQAGTDNDTPAGSIGLQASTPRLFNLHLAPASAPTVARFKGIVAQRDECERYIQEMYHDVQTYAGIASQVAKTGHNYRNVMSISPTTTPTWTTSTNISTQALENVNSARLTVSQTGNTTGATRLQGTILLDAEPGGKDT